MARKKGKMSECVARSRHAPESLKSAERARRIARSSHEDVKTRRCMCVCAFNAAALENRL